MECYGVGIERESDFGACIVVLHSVAGSVYKVCFVHGVFLMKSEMQLVS